MEGLAPGGQLSIFNAIETAAAATPSIPRDALDWEMEGRNFYNRNLECKPPPECPAANVTDFTKGWHDMQERTAWAMAESGKIIDRDPTKRPAGPVPLDPEPERLERSTADGSTRAPDGSRPSVIAGYKIAALADGGWVVDFPNDEEMDGTFETEEAAWDAADRHLDENPGVVAQGETDED